MNAHLILEIIELVWLAAVTVFIFNVARKIGKERRKRNGHADTI